MAIFKRKRNKGIKYRLYNKNMKQSKIQRFKAIRKAIRKVICKRRYKEEYKRKNIIYIIQITNKKNHVVKNKTILL